MGFGHQNLPHDERSAMSALKRTDGSPVTRSRRLALRECGIAYRPRGPRRRSRRSSRSARESHTGRRAAGDGRLPAARYARCGTPPPHRLSFECCSKKATGEVIDTETVTISSEGGRGKRAAGNLAGGLLYFTSSS